MIIMYVVRNLRALQFADICTAVTLAISANFTQENLIIYLMSHWEFRRTIL